MGLGLIVQKLQPTPPFPKSTLQHGPSGTLSDTHEPMPPYSFSWHPFRANKLGRRRLFFFFPFHRNLIILLARPLFPRRFSPLFHPFISLVLPNWGWQRKGSLGKGGEGGERGIRSPAGGRGAGKEGLLRNSPFPARPLIK